MIGAVSNHLWQSTIFVIFAAIVAHALRKNGAHVRHAVWLTASLKFFVPFSLLMALGSQWAWPRTIATTTEPPAIETVSVVMDQIAQPFTGVLPTAPLPQRSEIDWMPWLMGGVWIAGFLVIMAMRLRGWARVRAAVRSSVPLTIPGLALPSHVEIRSSSGLLEPGIVGFWRSTMLVPAGIDQQLTPMQLEAVLAHELCHVRRRDNMTAAMHMAVEASFWFHPLVWWIGARMVDERERACDEHVLRVVGRPEEYAEGILNVCKLYVESPLACVAGLGSPKRLFGGGASNLKKRIEAIMVNRVGLRLNLARKTAIVAAAVLALAAPVVVGVITSPVRMFGQASGGPERFDVVSIKPCAAPGQQAPGTPGGAGGRGGGSSAPWHAQTSPGRVYWDCVTLPTLVDQAFADTEHRLLNITGDSRPPLPTSTKPKRVRSGPAWADKEMFTIEVTAATDLTTAALSGAALRNLATLPPGMSHALRAVLEDRFQVKVHRASELQDMYALRLGVNGLNGDRMKPTKPGECVTQAEFSAADPADRLNLKVCGNRFVTLLAWEFTGGALSNLALALSDSLDRYVLDETATSGMFNFVAQFRDSLNDNGGDFEGRVIRALDVLGLKIQPTKASAEFLVIDRAERPTPNEAFAATVDLRFDVASIKPCDPSDMNSGARGGGAPNFVNSPGRTTINCLSAVHLINRAFIMNGSQPADDPINAWAGLHGMGFNAPTGEPLKIRGGPSWMYTDKYSIEATATGGAGEPTMMGAMLRALITERFQLTFHQETEEAPMWALTLANGGHKLKRGECTPFEFGKTNVRDALAANPGKLMCGPFVGGAASPITSWKLGGSSMADLTRLLGREIGVPVVDRTGLTGAFNIAFEYGPDEVFSAVQAQLGLKLTQIKGRRGFLVIDRIERPSPDAPSSSLTRPFAPRRP